MDFPIVITQADYENYLTNQHKFRLKVIVSIIKGFKEMGNGAKPSGNTTENKRSAGSSEDSPKPSVASSDRIPVNGNEVKRRVD